MLRHSTLLWSSGDLNCPRHCSLCARLSYPVRICSTSPCPQEESTAELGTRMYLCIRLHTTRYTSGASGGPTSIPSTCIYITSWSYLGVDVERCTRKGKYTTPSPEQILRVAAESDSKRQTLVGEIFCIVMFLGIPIKVQWVGSMLWGVLCQ